MTDTSKGLSEWRRGLYSFFAVLIISGALYSGYLYFSTVRAIFARTTLPFIDNVASVNTIPGRAPEQELPNIAQKKERVNILVLGIDQRETEPGPWRTDTIILVSIDPATESLAMLSIPRDLWVTIPGFGENRINNAHFLGDLRNYPGGGVALAKKTVWHALGVPVHYYVRLNFSGFERLIDAIGGVTIEVEREIYDTKYPDSQYGTMTVHIPAGVQHMDGKTALQYARSRHGNSDFDRMERQQQVIMAARDKVLSLDIPLTRIPRFIELVGESVQTDMTLEEILAIAQVAKHIDGSRIRRGVIDGSMTTTVTTPQGWMVEVADWAQVRALVDELFPAPVSSLAMAAQPITSRLTEEHARIEIQNGTLVPGLAQTAAQHLREQGFNVVGHDSADRLDYAQTIIIAFDDKPHTVESLMAYLGLTPEQVRQEARPGMDVDIRLILGRDVIQAIGQP